MHSIFQGETGGELIVTYSGIVANAVSGYALVLGKHTYYNFTGRLGSGNLYIANSGLSQLPNGDYTVLPQVIDSDSLVYFLETQDLQVIEVPDYPSNLILTSAHSVLSALEQELTADLAVETAARIATDTALQAQINTLNSDLDTLEVQFSDLDGAYLSADVVVSGYLTQQFTAADSTLRSLVESEFRDADTVVSGYVTQQLTVAFTAADSTLHSIIESEFQDADTVVSGYLTEQFTLADSTLETAIESEFQSADVVVSGYLTSKFIQADNVLKSSLESEFADADVLVSGYLADQITVQVAAVQSDIDTHIADFNNPHQVTAAQTGALTQVIADSRYSQLGHTHNYSDLTNKPTTVADFGITDHLAYTDREQTFTAGQTVSSGNVIVSSGGIIVRDTSMVGTNVGYSTTLATALFVPATSGDPASTSYFGSRQAWANRVAIVADSTGAPAAQLTGSGTDTLRVYNLGNQVSALLIREGEQNSNTITALLRLSNRTRAGTVAAIGYGAALDLTLSSDSLNDRQAGRISAIWLDPRQGSQSSALTFSTVNVGGNYAERMRITNSGTLLVRSTDATQAAGIYVPWVSGDTLPTSVFGTSASNQIAVQGISSSNTGVKGQSTSSIGIHALSTSSLPFVAERSNNLTNAIASGIVLRHITSNTPLTNYGVSVAFQLQSSTTQNMDAAQVSAIWLDANHASRSSAVTIATALNGTVTERVRITSSGALLVGKTSGLSGTGDVDIAGNLNIVGTVTALGGHVQETYTDYTANGTFTIPSGARFVRILAVAPGGGGGAGRRGAAGSARFGGGGGGAGSTVEATYTVAEIVGANNNLSIVIPASGGAGAQSQTSDNSDGAAGGNAGNITVSNSSGRVLVFAGGGVGGNGGTATAGAGGNPGIGTTVGGIGGASSTSATGGVGGTSNGLAGGAGGGGGGIDTGNTARAGGPGGHGSRSFWSSVIANGGAVDSTAPQNGGTPGLFLAGGGGGGGAASVTTTAQTGGNGGTYGGGGGGGGASVNGQSSGGGGGGAPGFVRISVW